MSPEPSFINGIPKSHRKSRDSGSSAVDKNWIPISSQYFFITLKSLYDNSSFFNMSY